MAKNIKTSGRMGSNQIVPQARKSAAPGPRAKRAKAKFKPPRLKNYG